MKHKAIYDNKVNTDYTPKKILRQLNVFEIFRSCSCVEFDELWQNNIICSKKTFLRDITELSHAGVCIAFGLVHNGIFQEDKPAKGYYLKADETKKNLENPCGTIIGTIPYQNHIKKLNRLITILLSQPTTEAIPYDPPEEWYEDHDVEEDFVFQRPKDYKSNFITWYKETFPDCSERTMQRDFRILNQLDHVFIHYHNTYKMYEIDFGCND